MKEQPGGHGVEAVAPEGDPAGPRRRDRAAGGGRRGSPGRGLRGAPRGRGVDAVPARRPGPPVSQTPELRTLQEEFQGLA